MSKSPITCHVLDSSIGRPAQGVKVALAVLDGSAHIAELATGSTNSDGRCSDLLDPQTKLSPGIYKMTFFTGDYFEANKTDVFYPLVEITFSYTDPAQHYHIPLLISPFSYTTYRGS